jgi:iron complex outermembrane receptor protein
LDVEHRFGKTYYVSGAGFLTRIDDLINQGFDVVTTNPTFANATPVQTKGIELEFGAKWANGVEGSISDSLQDSENVATTNVLTNSPRNLAKVNLSLPLPRTKFFSGVEAQYVSRRTTVAQTVLGGYFVTNITFFRRRLADNLDFSAGVYNLFDKHYSESGSINVVESSIPQDGRSFRIKLTYQPHLIGR